MLRKAAMSFFKVGCIGFGGGSALIPVIENEIVKQKQLLPEQDFAEHTIVSNITPGALPVKLGCLAGHKLAGVRGMLSCATLVALPGTAVTVILLALLSKLGTGAVHQITLASVGISAFIVYLLLEYIQKVFRDAAKENFSRIATFLMLFTFAVTCGTKLREFLIILLGESPLWSTSPILSLSTIDLLGLAFFVIFFTGGQVKSLRMVIASVVTIAYLFLFGKGSPFPDSRTGLWLRLLMLLLAIIFLIYDIVHTAAEKPKKPEWKKLFWQIAAWILFIVSCCLPAIFAFDGISGFLRDGALSTITSFGGGEAYLSVADGMFVATGKTTPAVFYGQLVPVANAFPGPILVKVLSGVGYIMGFEAGGTGTGFAMALAGFGAAIGSTGIVCVLVDSVYSCFTNLRTFQVLKQWILPIICGLLLTVILSMLCETIKVTGEAGLGSAMSLLFFAALFAAVRLLAHRFRLNDVFVIAIVGGASALLLNLPLS